MPESRPLRSSTSRTIRIRSTSTSSKRRSAVRHPPPWDSAAKPTWRSSCATLARSSPASAGGPGATAANCRAYGWQPRLRGRGLATQLLAAAEAEAAARGCSQTVHFTYAFQARELYEKNGYELVGCVEDFPSGTDVLWYRKRLNPPTSPPSRERSRSEKPSQNTAALMTGPDPQAGPGRDPDRAWAGKLRGKTRILTGADLCGKPVDRPDELAAGITGSSGTVIPVSPPVPRHALAELERLEPGPIPTRRRRAADWCWQEACPRKRWSTPWLARTSIELPGWWTRSGSPCQIQRLEDHEARHQQAGPPT